MTRRESILLAIIAILITVNLSSRAQSNSHEPERKAGWDYKVHEVTDSPSAIEAGISTATNEGWELIGLVGSVKDTPGFSVRRGESFGSLSIKTGIKLVFRRAK